VGGSPEKQTSMDGVKVKIRAGMSAQTSMGSTTATIGGHGEEQSSLRIASGRALGITGAGHLSGNATATFHAT